MSMPLQSVGKLPAGSIGEIVIDVRAFVIAAVSVAIAPALAAADDAERSASVSGALGAGMFGADPAGSVDLGIDLAGDDYSVGLGGRLRWIGESGIRGEDWDDASEIATVIRYATLHRVDENGAGVSVAAGELGSASMGHGAVFDGYTTGVDIDSRRLGVAARASSSTLSGELIVDDVTAPRVAGARGALSLGGGVRLGATAAFDRDVPDAMGRRLLPIAAMDVALGGHTADEIARGDVYVDVAGVVGSGAGTHLGLRGDLSLAERALVVGARLEGRAHTRGYVAGRFGPLYDIERDVGSDRMGRIEAGLGAEAAVSVELPGIASASASYDRRAGLPDQVVVRVSAPHFLRVQLGLWAAANLGRLGGQRVAAGAAEMRIRLPRRLFVGADAARLYRETDAGLSPAWMATAWVGAVLGEPR